MRPRKTKEVGFDEGTNRTISSLRAAVEHVIKSIKDFKVMRGIRLGEAETRLKGIGNLISAAMNLPKEATGPGTRAMSG